MDNQAHKSRDKISRAPDFDLRDRIDEHIERNFPPSVLIDAICNRPEIDPALVARSRAKAQLTEAEISTVALLADRAIFDIETLNTYFCSPTIEFEKNGACFVGIRSTELPRAPSPDGNLFLCMIVHQNKPDLSASYKVVALRIDGDELTVVVSGHACDQIAARAGIRGSLVAFFASSIANNKSRVFAQAGRGERLLLVHGLSGEPLGYCPVDRVSCELTPHGLDSPLGIETCCEKNRWRLKTFLNLDMVDESSLRPVRD